MQVRANADALGANVPILYTGDFNDTGTDEPMSQTLMKAGNGQAYDPINRSGHWDYNSAFADIDTIRSTGLNGRFDMLWESGVVRNGHGGNGLQDMPATYHPFGNNGSVGYNHSVAASNNTALPDLANRTTVLTDLTHCSDHIPNLMAYSVGGQAAQATQFNVIANPSSVAGTAFDFTVQALDANGNLVPSYRGTVTFSSGDPYSASLPNNYTFTSGDQGQHTFVRGASLYTAGTWDVTATDISSGITGSALINVQAAPAVGLALIAPSTAVSGAPFDVTVIAQDPYGNTDTNYGGTVSWASSDPDPGVMLPADYTFQPGDQGQVYYPGGVTLITPGDQQLVAFDTGNNSINGGADVFVTSNSAPGQGNRFGGTARQASVGMFGLAAAPTVSPSPTRADVGPSGQANSAVDTWFVVRTNQQSTPAGQPSAATAAFLLRANGGLAPGLFQTELIVDPIAG
jgi:hypothetical protein